MNWKKFLKPDWRKIILTIIFIVLTYILTVFVIAIFPIYDNFPAKYFLTDIDWIIVCVGPMACGPQLIYGPNILGIIFLLIISYFLSCLIVWVYDKYKKKK